MIRRGPRAAILALVATLAVGAGSVLAYPSAESGARAAPADLWAHICDAVDGELFDALECVRGTGIPWTDGQRQLLQNFCERALGGTYIRRSEYPFEYALCEDVAG